MIVMLCALLSGALFFLSIGLGNVWPLAWIAPVPLLWLAFGPQPRWQVFLASFAAFAIGQLNLLEAYMILAPIVAVSTAIGASIFAGVILFARWAQRRLPPLVAVFAFPALWTSMEFLNALTSPNGSFGAFAYSQVPAPFLIQSASLFGLWSVTFLLCLVASAIALVLREKRKAMAAGTAVAVLFTANVAFGYARLAVPAGQMERVGAAGDDSIRFGASHENAVGVANAYAAAARELAAKGAKTIVLPENWRS